MVSGEKIIVLLEEDKSFVESGPDRRVEVILYPERRRERPERQTMNSVPYPDRPGIEKEIQWQSGLWIRWIWNSAPGRSSAFWGPTGPGKTTTFYIIVGLIQPEGGQVFLRGEEITHDPMYLRARKGVTYLPQEPSVFRKLTVEENLLAILETLDLSAEEREEAAGHAPGRTEDFPLAKRKAFSLSGGERRRVEITPGSGDLASVHPPGRALCGNRSSGGGRHSEYHLPAESQRDRGRHFRS